MIRSRCFLPVVFFLLLFGSNLYGETAVELLTKGMAEIAAGKIDDAIETFNRSIAVDPNMSRTYSNLGLCYTYKQQYDKAEDFYKKAISLDRKDYLPDLYRASNSMGLERYKEALDALNECVEKEPRLEGTYLLISYCRYALNEDDEATKAVDKALSIIQDRPSDFRGLLLVVKGAVELRNGRYDQAARDLEPDDPKMDKQESYIYLCELYDRRGDHVLSTKYCNKINQIHSAEDGVRAIQSNIGSFTLRASDLSRSKRIAISGAAYSLTGDKDKALARLDEAVKLSPKGSFAHTRRAIVKIHWGDLEGAIADLDQSIRINPANAKNYLFKSAAEISIHPEESSNLAKKVIDLRTWRDPDSTTAAIVGAIGAIKAGDKKTANSLVDDAIKHVKKNVWPYPILKFLRGEFDENLLNKSARTPDQKSDARAVTGLYAIARGKKDKAAEHFHWLIKQGEPRSLFFDIAMNELRRIDGAKVVDKALEQYYAKLYKKTADVK